MEHTTLGAYRHVLYACFRGARDALFDLGDALVTAPGARTLVELSQAPSFQRRWPSVYAALRDGQIDGAALRALFVASAPTPPAGERLVLAVDGSPIPRPYAPTVPDRTLVHVPAGGRVLPPRTAPVQPGWAYSTLVVVPDPPSSWTHVLDQRRVPSESTATQVGAAQLAAVVPLLPTRPLCLADGAYGHAGWVAATAEVAADQLVRAAATRVLYLPAPPLTGRRGRPALDGPRFQGSDPTTHPTPDGDWTGSDAHGQAVRLRWWGGLHLKAARAVPITAVCLTRAGAAGTPRAPRDTWFWWLGGQPLPPPSELARLYPRRFSIEHGYRFDKQDLLWAAPRVRTPEQMDRWTQLVAAVHNELGLARDLVQAARWPWESPTRALTPRQVRRALPRLLHQFGTPAAVPLPRGKAPGRARGTRLTPAARHPVIRKGPRRRPKRRRIA